MCLINQEFSAFFFGPLQFIFACTMVKYCAVALCRNGSKKRPDLNYFCFPTRPNERKKWEVFCKRADKKFKTLGDPRICPLHFKESDIEISISGRKSVRSDCYLTIFDPTKSANTVSSRSKGRDSVMNNRKLRKFVPESLMLRTP